MDQYELHHCGDADGHIVAPSNEAGQREIVSTYIYTGNPDDPDPPEESVSFKSKEVAPAMEKPSEDEWPMIFQSEPSPPLPASLKFTGELVRARTNAIAIDVTEIPVKFHKHDLNPGF